MQDLPAPVRAKAVGAGAQQWLADLPSLVADLAARWSLTVGAAFPDGTEAHVLAVTRADGTPAVLKLLVPRPGEAAHHEISVLRLTAGVGCARLLACDEPRGALLLERLGPAMSELSLPQPDRLAILCDLAATVWRSPTAGPPPVPSGADQAAWIAASIPRKWEELGRPCSRAAVDHALAAAESRRKAHDPTRAVLNHGDVHQWNALRSGDGFKLVDPDGVWAEPECDLGVLMREDPVELMAGDPWDRAHRLAARSCTDPVAIWEWGVADRVNTGLVLTAVGLQPVAAQMLAAADRIASARS
ncbi:aminoglycoside phosphotransferase family protein [Paractinoplanes lichenicola]|uniref:aminoglycoside phosphotransferase family protein n=1 Tax=Paractinoplanes lichenicola TaxID=2802976 RepID=UPI0027DCA269|nr:aminoglycoside phosphotransferase family protein [Actinoplanes lichenicola]